MAEEWMHMVDGSFVNPDPIVQEESDIIINDFLSPAKLQDLTGESDLAKVTLLEMVVDTRETTLGNFGQYLPQLKQLKLSNSLIPSVRDIGTSLLNLQVLWMSRCGLNDIDGIASIHNLKELYIAFNNINDVSPLSFLESLEVLDLEGNQILENEQLDYLAIMPNLLTLTLTGNPICQNARAQGDPVSSFRDLVLNKLPQLQTFNDVVQVMDSSSDRPETSSSSHSQEDIDLITTAIKEGIIIDSDIRLPSSVVIANRSMSPETLALAMPAHKHLPRPRPATAGSQRRVDIPSPEGRMLIPKPQARPGSSGSESGILQQDDSSHLTFGNPICGNPMLGLRNRKKSPIPPMSFLQEDKFPLARPSTAIGVLRKPFNVGQELKVDFFPSSAISKADTTSSPNQDSPKTDKPLSPTRPLETPMKKLPSPPSSSKPIFKSPTPPRSPQRPQTAADFRAVRYRRSYPVSPGPSAVNVMSVNSMSPTLHSSIQKEIEDLS